MWRGLAYVTDQEPNNSSSSVHRYTDKIFLQNWTVRASTSGYALRPAGQCIQQRHGQSNRSFSSNVYRLYDYGLVSHVSRRTVPGLTAEAVSTVALTEDQYPSDQDNTD